VQAPDLLFHKQEPELDQLFHKQVQERDHWFRKPNLLFFRQSWSVPPFMESGFIMRFA
jgi:hypothetical protein